MSNEQGIPNVSEVELGWLAGIIDGEGSVILFLGVRKGEKLNNVSPEVVMGNTDFAMIDRYVDILGRLGVGLFVGTKLPSYKTGIENSHPSTKKYKPLKVVTTAGFLRVKKLLDVVTPYLVTDKRKKSELLLQLIDRRLSRCVANGKYSNKRYDVGDLQIMWQICQMMKSKHAHIVEDRLKDCIRGSIHP